MAQELVFIIRTYDTWTDEAVQAVADEFVRMYDGNVAIESAYLAEVRQIQGRAWDCSHCGKHIETPGTYGPEHDPECELYDEVNHCDVECDEPTDHNGPCPGYEPPWWFAEGYSVGCYGTPEPSLEGLTDIEVGQYNRGKAAGEAVPDDPPVTQDPEDDCFDVNGGPLPRCDTCGAPCDRKGCTTDRAHQTARP